MEIILQPWAWYVGGAAIAAVMFLLLYLGGNFGVSSNFRTMCTLSGAGKYADFFKIDWRAQSWNLLFVAGSIIGGFIAMQYLTPDQRIQLDADTVQELESWGLQNVGAAYLPAELFGASVLTSWSGLLMLLVGGFLVGFGTRYAGGCTSGHAISGLSNLQLPSLIAVIGFFIGGLLMTYWLLPLLFNYSNIV
jgi:uncharacterized membrane protein YedE/YeeE